MLIVRIQTNAAGLVEARRARLNKGAVDLVGTGGTEIEAVADLSRQLVEEAQIPYRVRKATVRTAAKLPRKGSKAREELETLAAASPVVAAEAEEPAALIAAVEKECDGCCEDCDEADGLDEYDEYEEEEDEDEEEF